MAAGMILRALLAGLAITLALGAPARADSCDGLTVRLIRGTGVALAGRSGLIVVFRAADAERMSLDCAAPRRLLFRSAEREPPRLPRIPRRGGGRRRPRRAGSPRRCQAYRTRGGTGSRRRR